MDIKQLGAVFIQSGLVDADEIESVLDENRGQREENLGQTLVRLGFATEREVAQAVAVMIGVPFIDLRDITPDPAAVALISRQLAVSARVIPVAVERNELILAMVNPQDVQALDAAGFATGLPMSPRMASPDAMTEVIARVYTVSESVDEIIKNVAHHQGVEIINSASQDDTEDIRQIKRKSELAPIVRLANETIFQGVVARASDIHLEPKEKHSLVRHRVDGMLEHSMDVPRWVHASLVSRFKIMSGMDIAERRVPQDGRIRIKLQERIIDLRLSTLPTRYGEKVVIRILDSAHNVMALPELGFFPQDLRRVTNLLSQGMLLMAGPTGSGKTTTAYSLLRELVDREINIIGVEDPIEYVVDGLNQVQVNEKAGLTFARTLRSILRQDPDAIFVGEIRDGETAEIAMRAAITGHVVVSTVHTSDAPSTAIRLIDLGVEPALVASALNGIIAQRLLRLICDRCRDLTEPDAATISRIERATGGQPLSFALYEGRGCNHCQHTGYRGRIGAFEVMNVTPAIRQLIVQGASEDAIREAGSKAGMRTMFEDALDKVRQGMTTINELDRVLLMPAPEESPAPQALCASCQRPRDPDWQLCPFCGAPIDGPSQVVATAPPAAALGFTGGPEPNAAEATQVLLVDDEQPVLDVLARFLIKRGLVVRTAMNGREALSSVARNKPHVVVTDVLMPEMTGLQLIEHLRKDVTTAFIPVIILSQKTSIADQVKGFAVGIDDYLAKPISPPELLASISEALKRLEQPALNRET